METDSVGPNQKGAIGEALVFGGRIVPSPIENGIQSFIEDTYPLAENTPIRVSHGSADHFTVSTDGGETVSAQTDGSFIAKVIPDIHEDRIERRSDGSIKNKWNLQTQIHFPVEVKSGEYAELERGQKEVLEAISGADTMRHPMLIKVQIKKLPEEYEISSKML